MKKLLSCTAVCLMLISLVGCKKDDKYNFDGYDVIIQGDDSSNIITFSSLADLEAYTNQEFSLPENFSLMDENLNATNYNEVTTADFKALQVVYNNSYVIRQSEGYLGNISGCMTDKVEVKVINGENVTVYYEDEVPVAAWVERSNKTFAFYKADGFDDLSVIEDIILAIE